MNLIVLTFAQFSNEFLYDFSLEHPEWESNAWFHTAAMNPNRLVCLSTVVKMGILEDPLQLLYNVLDVYVDLQSE